MEFTETCKMPSSSQIYLIYRHKVTQLMNSAPGKVSQTPSPPSFCYPRLQVMSPTSQSNSPPEGWGASGELFPVFNVNPCEQGLRRNGSYASMSLWGSNKHLQGESWYSNKTKPSHPHLCISFLHLSITLWKECVCHLRSPWNGSLVKTLSFSKLRSGREISNL